MLKLDLTKQAVKFIRTLDAKQFRQVINKIIGIMDNPNQSDIEQLKGYPYKKGDIGEYRIIFRVEGDCLKVSFVGKRNDAEVYRELK